MGNKIRVGIIRCDLHAIYYANVVQKHDPYILRDPKYGKGGYFYFYTEYRDPAQMTIPQVPGFEIVKLWDEDRQQAENMSKIYYGAPKICQTFEEVSDGVDLVLVADCFGPDGRDHLKFASPGIKKGVPTFIDKPFAYEVGDARKLAALAEKYGTPIMSLSILKSLPHAARFRARFAEIGEPEFGIIKGGGDTMGGHIHSISLAQYLFGSGVESVECMGKTPLAYVHLDYGKKTGHPQAGVMLNCASGGTYHCSFYASAYSKLGVVHSSHLGDYEFPYAVVEIWKKIKKMVKTRKPQVPYEEMVEGIAIASAARLSQKERRRVRMKEV